MKKTFIFIISAFVFLMLVSCGQEVLYHGLTEREANEIIVILEQNGISSKKIMDESQKKSLVFNIVVSPEDKSRSLEVLRENGLPRINPVGIYDVFSSSSLIPTITEEKAKYQMAMQGEIEKTLLQMQNVISARVHIVIPDAGNLESRSSAIVPKASVFVKYHQGLQQSSSFTEKDIQNIVAGSVLDLTPGNINVVLQRVQLIEGTTAATNYTRFLFFNIAPESKKGMQISLVAVLIILFILAFSVVILYIKTKELKTSLSIIKSKK